MKSISLALVLCLVMNTANAQPLKELRIGDTLPPLNVSYLSGDSIVTVPLKTLYKDNHLILDFWATWCGACIKAMPIIDSIAGMFNKSVKILPVTYEDAKLVKKFILKNKILSKLDLNYVVNDSILMGGHFKFEVVPHEVWVNPKGVICAITYPDDITYENVNLFINNQKLPIKEKIDDLTFNILEPLEVDNNSILYRSVLTPSKVGIPSYKLDGLIPNGLVPIYVKGRRVNRFMATNSNILSLFYASYSHNLGSIKFNRIELNVKDTFSLLCPYFMNRETSLQINMQTGYCYELLLPQEVSGNILYTYLLEDLNRLFPFRGSIEKRNRECWVLKNKDKSKNPTTLGLTPKLYWEKGLMKKLNNQTMEVLASYLNWEMDSLPVLDETHFKDSFDMNIDVIMNEKTGVFDIERIRKSLNTYGFDIIKSIRPIDILVIRDKKNE